MKLLSITELTESVQQWHVERTLEHVADATVKIVTATIDKRDSSSTCAANDNSAECQKYQSSGSSVQTLAIALGAGIPLGCAVIVLFFLHRRHLKRQRLEDLNDPHKSLDFGNDEGYSKHGKGGPEMKDKTRIQRGLSMDMDLGSPYLLPGELHGSRASLHSMSRSLKDEHDPYRPVTLVKSDWESVRAPRRPGDNGSVFSAAGSMQSSQENASLVANARPMSQSFPARGASQSPPIQQPPRALINADRKPTLTGHSSTGSAEKSFPDLSPKLNLDDFVPPPPPPPPKEEETRLPKRSSSISTVNRPPRKSSIAKHPPAPLDLEPLPAAALTTPSIALPEVITSFDDPNDFNLDLYTSQQNEHVNPDMLAQPQTQTNRFSIMGLRPLPSDLPDDNPEQRANRIRSFYREYFDDSRPNPKGGYVDDYDAGYLADHALYDNAAGGFVPQGRPFAQPVQRRAMTPPPSRGRQNMMPDPHRRHMSTQSTAMRGPRARAQSAPRKQLPPPSALTSLPTPHLLKDDYSIFNATDFAPPASYRDRQAGRAPDSPLGVARPYSPNVAAHSPLIASYDELAAVPSPYLLRKSGTFTALDFAAPPRFRDQGNASDAGSIRSNRSGISHIQQNAIRQGAYRVSRIPTEMVTSKDQIAAQLKPRWDMRNGNNIMG
ncbi:hypothetical protein AMS68_003420 [Peltaster fructicola]|uniref:Uncharacterized protein n=1 Tax=Peltaster fructicola TaxID=286661 RepID=A0A6H0XT58_9PEZI|nr:hypothetical protein AMS68_003420 [Peltaster fructicola]